MKLAPNQIEAIMVLQLTWHGQARGTLRDDSGLFAKFCAVGLLKHKAKARDLHTVRNHFGITPTGMDRMMHKNDACRFTFKQIAADMLENPREYFTP